MVSLKELKARISTDFKFDKQELITLGVAILITAFIFSFRDWGGDQFDAATGVRNLVILVVITAISFLFRFSCQKIYALSEGYNTRFRVFWAGLIITLVMTFLTQGIVPLILVGGVATTMITRHRLGKFRYGFSHFQNALIGFWGIAANIILAILFALGLYFFPESYFFVKGLWLNLIMGFLALIPITQLDGLHIFFGSRIVYFLAIIMVLLAGLLLLSQTMIGLILAIVVATSLGIFFLLIRSEK